MEDKNLLTKMKKKWEACWGGLYPKPAWSDRPIPPEIPYLIEKKYLPPKGSVLDIGCGTADISRWFYEAGNYTVDAFDISETAIEIAKTRHAKTKIHFFCHDICAEGLHKKYDILIDRGCLHTIPADLLPSYAKHITHACNPHGKFLIFVRAFRSTSELSPDEETKRYKSNIELLFSSYFEITLMHKTDLGNSKEAGMPGLFFLLTRHAK